VEPKEAIGMATFHVPPGTPDSSPCARLERGEVVYYPVCPFPLPEGDDRTFLLEQRLANRAHKNISYNPHTAKAAGFLLHSPEQAERLRRLLAEFSRTITDWAAQTFPSYAHAWRLDRVSFRPEEEATRTLRLKARNDLLHVDAFPSRPTQGHRIFRIFANVNLTEPRIWVTSEPFTKLLERYGAAAGLPGRDRADWFRQLRRDVLGLFRPGQPKRSPYDAFMLRLHDYLKGNEDFQERTPKCFWTFGTGSAWVAFTDACSHAVLRGRYALEHSYFVAPEGLVLPEESPPALLARACGLPVLGQAA
jgi:hypothetical protein